MNRKGFSIIGFLVAILFLGIIVFLGWKVRNENTAAQNKPTEETVLYLLKDNLFTDCKLGGDAEKYTSCIVNIYKSGNNWKTSVTFDNVYDESIKALRTEATILESNGRWTKNDILHTQLCRPQRGHQDFSKEPCL